MNKKVIVEDKTHKVNHLCNTAMYYVDDFFLLCDGYGCLWMV